jgi:hypothetical protein
MTRSGRHSRSWLSQLAEWFTIPLPMNSRRTLDYMEMFPHNLLNGPARHVGLIPYWSWLWVLYFKLFGIMVSDR